ncbi:MAG: peptide deformylase [bacterium]
MKRPASVRLHAYSLTGEPFEAQIDGLLARIVQHETDHLDATLFIDRLSPAHTLDIRPVLDEFELAFTNLTGSGEMPGDEQIAARWKELEDRYS